MKYMFSIEATISMNIEVEANTPEAALKLAHEAPVMSLCHLCSDSVPGEWATSGELDFDPTSSPLVSVEGEGVDEKIQKKLIAQWNKFES